MSNDTAQPDIEDGGRMEMELRQQSAGLTLAGHEDLAAVDAGRDLLWKDVQYSITVGQGTDSRIKTILSDCWGIAKSGETSAILGPSGSGKTTLLNVLSGRTVNGHKRHVSAQLALGNNRLDPSRSRHQVAYLLQDDGLLGTATPREAIAFSAHLRLSGVTNKEVDVMVQSLLEQLDMLGCADTLIGGGLIPGISGGERKRASVGVEMIVRPSVFLLDEPLSGLDSFTAQSLVSILCKIAAKGSTVMCTIHQPSSRIFYMFQRVIFMKNGRIFYQGPTDGLLQWLNSYQFMCPPNFDLGDFTMDVLHTHSTKDLTDMNMFMPLPSDSASSIGIQYIDDMSAYFIEQWRVAEEAPGSELPEAAYVAAWWLQCTWLLYREALNIGRNLPALKGRFGITIFISAMLAIIFNNVAKGNNADSADFQAHNGAITAIAIVSMFGSAIITLMEFPTERPLFVREHASGTYGAVPYFFSKAILELPLTLLQNVIGFLIVYWVVGFRGEFVYFVLSGWLISLTSASLATVAGSIIPDPKQAVGVAPILFVPQIMFAGFFIPTSQIPFWFRWIQYICGLKYGVNLYLINEFSLTRPSCDDAAEFNCRRVLDSNDIDANKWYIYVCIMLGIYIALRSLACAILAKLAMKPI